VAEIAFSCGFADQSHLTRVFTAQTVLVQVSGACRMPDYIPPTRQQHNCASRESIVAVHPSKLSLMGPAGWKISAKARQRRGGRLYAQKD